MMRDFAIKGHICHTPHCGKMEILEDGYVVCVNGRSEGVFAQLPDRYHGLELIDASGMLVIPGMVDLHTHAPQYAFMGIGMDYELMEWLEKTTFPEETRYADLAYARKAYQIFADRIRRSATTRSVIFGTIHRPATLLLMDLMEETGIVSMVGKVNMDRNAPAGLLEKDAGTSADETRRFIEESIDRGYRRTMPILTPRFIPCCSEDLLSLLDGIRQEYGLGVQSHLSENPNEIDFVKELVPEAEFYGDAYDRHGLFGRQAKTVMAHCVYSTPEELERMRKNGVWAAHCPASNTNLASGIAPVRRYLEKGLRIGLGTDVAAGTSESMFREVIDAIQVSKLYWRYIDQDARPLTFPECFYLATKGGGSFFGKVGSFEEGYEFDALVLDDSGAPAPRTLSAAERLERAFYTGLDRGGLVRKFAAGTEVNL